MQRACTRQQIQSQLASGERLLKERRHLFAPLQPFLEKMCVITASPSPESFQLEQAGMQRRNVGGSSKHVNEKELNEFGQFSLAKQKLRSNSLVLSIDTSRR